MPTLFDPIRIGDLLLPNRVLMAPLTRSRTGDDRVPNDLMRDYYVQRASAGLILTEATCISPDSVGYERTPGIWSAGQVGVGVAGVSGLVGVPGVVSSAGGVVVPSAGAVEVPSAGGVVVPSAGGVVVPSAGGVVVTWAGGRVVPSAGGVVVPSAGGVVVPSAGGVVVSLGG